MSPCLELKDGKSAWTEKETKTKTKAEQNRIKNSPSVNEAGGQSKLKPGEKLLRNIVSPLPCYSHNMP